jgi:hypothetical protein
LVTLRLGVFFHFSLALAVASQHTHATPNTASTTEVKFPNFTSCTVAELQRAVPELKGLKTAPNQKKLAALLGKVGAKTLDIARKTPNLIARETVTEGLLGIGESRHDYDYLILTRSDGSVVDFKEFRVDLKSGAKFQIDEELKNESPTWADVERARDERAASHSRPPASQGFATSWLQRFTADIQFAPTRIEQVPALLSLPRDITITSRVSGWTLREIHKYSEYRLFRVQFRIVVNP